MKAAIITIYDKRCKVVKDCVQTDYFEVLPRIGERIKLINIGEFEIKDIIHSNSNGSHCIDIYMDYDSEL